MFGVSIMRWYVLDPKNERTGQGKWYHLVVELFAHKGGYRAKRLIAVELAMCDISSDIVVRKRSHELIDPLRRNKCNESENNCTIQIRISLASAVPGIV